MTRRAPSHPVLERARPLEAVRIARGHARRQLSRWKRARAARSSVRTAPGKTTLINLICGTAARRVPATIRIARPRRDAAGRGGAREGGHRADVPDHQPVSPAHRRGEPRAGRRRAPRRRPAVCGRTAACARAIDARVAEILATLRLERRARAARRSAAVRRAAHGGARRSRWRSSRASCCSTSRPRACLRADVGRHLRRDRAAAGVDGGAAHRARHRHRLSLCQPRCRPGRGADPRGRHAGRDSASMRRCGPSTSVNPAMADILRARRNVTAGYGATVIVEDVSFSLRRGARAGRAWTQRRGQDHADADDRRTRDRHHGQVRLDDREIGTAPAWRRARLGMGYVPQERDIFPSLTVLENLTVGARPGAWTLDRIFELFPSLARAARQLRQPAVGRRTADAQHRARAGAPAYNPPAGRAVRRAGAEPGGHAGRHIPRAAPRRACRLSWSSSTRASRWA